MNIKNYVEDERIVVRLNGVEFSRLVESEKLFVLGVDMTDRIAKRTEHGILTVASLDPSRPVYALSRSSWMREQNEEARMAEMERNRFGDYDRGYQPQRNRRY